MLCKAHAQTRFVFTVDSLMMQRFVLLLFWISTIAFRDGCKVWIIRKVSYLCQGFVFCSQGRYSAEKLLSQDQWSLKASASQCVNLENVHRPNRWKNKRSLKWGFIFIDRSVGRWNSEVPNHWGSGCCVSCSAAKTNEPLNALKKVSFFTRWH